TGQGQDRSEQERPASPRGADRDAVVGPPDEGSVLGGGAWRERTLIGPVALGDRRGERGGEGGVGGPDRGGLREIGGPHGGRGGLADGGLRRECIDHLAGARKTAGGVDAEGLGEPVVEDGGEVGADLGDGAVAALEHGGAHGDDGPALEGADAGEG